MTDSYDHDWINMGEVTYDYANESCMLDEVCILCGDTRLVTWPMFTADSWGEVATKESE